MLPFEIKWKYVTGAKNAIADFPSQFPLPARPEECESDRMNDEMINAVEPDSKMKLKVEIIAEETSKDPVLSSLKRAILEGWPKSDPTELRTYKSIYPEIIPLSLRNRIPEVLHGPHLGIVRTKQVAKQYVFWPGMMRQIEDTVRSCEIFAETSKYDQPKGFTSWPQPEGPWERIHVDFLEVNGHKIFLMIDAYSKWLHLKKMEKNGCWSSNTGLRTNF